MRLGLSRSFWVMLAVIVLITVAAIAVPRVYRIALLGSGYMAQTLCAGMFVSGRTFEDVMAEDLTGPGLGTLRLFTPAVDASKKQVRAAAFGIASQTSIFRDGLGCTLIHHRSAEALRAETKGLFSPLSPHDPQAEWPTGSRVNIGSFPEGTDARAVAEAIDAIFSEPDPERPRGSRALVVVRDGRIVAERYAPGFDAHMPLIGWSMSKTATNTLIGLRSGDGDLALEDRELMPQWREPSDRRGEITLNDLMHMTSGLAFDESTSDNLSDVSQMIFVQENTAAFAADKPLIHAPGTHWYYSSGTTNIIAAVLRETFENDRDYLLFPRKRLFEPLGMRTAVFAPDASGTLMGSSLLYASARDWARLGLLFLQDGKWDGEQLLPEGWVAYTKRPVPQSPEDEYGAQVWLKLKDSPGFGEPPMPEDSFYMLGFDGQVVAMVPSKALVVVRLGLTPKGGDWEPARDLAPLVNAFPDRE